MKIRDLLQSRWTTPAESTIVEVVWEDAIAISMEQWIEEVDIDNQPAPSCSIGYLIAMDDRAVTLASVVNINALGHGITIPMGSILAIRTLEISGLIKAPEAPISMPMMHVDDLVTPEYEEPDVQVKPAGKGRKKPKSST